MEHSSNPPLQGSRGLLGLFEEAWRRQRQRRLRLALLALLVGAAAITIVRVQHHPSPRPLGNPTSIHGGRPGPASSAPVAPAPSRGTFLDNEFVCPIAPPNPDLPRRVGCISAAHAHVTGHDGRDLVLIYARLSSRSDEKVGQDFEPTSWWLEVVTPAGQRTRSHLDDIDNDPSIVRIGNVNDVAGDELFIQAYPISSGSPQYVYTDAAGTLRRVLTVIAGGDSATREQYSCQRAPEPEIIQKTAVLLGPTINGRWRWTTTTHRWHKSHINTLTSTQTVRRGQPGLGRLAYGGGCGHLVGQTGDQ